MIITHKILLQPNKLQADWLTEQCGYERWCYNRMLMQFKQGLDNGIWWDKNTLDKDLRRNKPEWTKGRWANAINTANLRLEVAIKSWLNDKQSNTFPLYKSRKTSISCSFQANVIRLETRKIRIPKIGWIRMQESLRFEGKVVGNATISYDGRRWWISLPVNTGEEPELKQGDKVVGVDVGIKTMAITSDGVEYANPRPLADALSSLRSVNKAIARSRNTHGKNKHSNRRNRLYSTRRRIYERIANIRKNAHRNAASTIAKSADVVCVETLNVQGMVKNRKLSRALSDAALGNFLKELAWQCYKRGTKLVEVSQWFPSSKTCSDCGLIKSNLMLSEREYVCGECGLIIDRDLNAALNLKRVGETALRGESVRPALAG